MLLLLLFSFLKGFKQCYVVSSDNVKEIEIGGQFVTLINHVLGSLEAGR